MRKEFLIAASIFILINSAFSQSDFEKFEQERKNEMAKMSSEQANWEKQQKEEFAKFVKEREAYIQKMDSEFTAYIAKEWVSFKSFKNPSPVKPKPKDQPKITVAAPSSQSTIVKTDKVNKPITVENNLPVLSKAEPEKFAKNVSQFTFYGTPISIEYDKKIVPVVNAEISETAISEALKKYTPTYYGNLINELSYYKNKMNLNDWGYYQLVKQFSEATMKKTGNNSVFLTWFVLLKSNYRAKLGAANQQLVLLLPFKQEIYGKPGVVIDQLKFFAIENKDLNSIVTYKNDFPEARRILDLSINLPIYLMPDMKTKKLVYEKDTLKLRYNANLVNFYKDYPLTNLDVYFGAQLSEVTRESIVGNFAKITKGQDESDAIATVLKVIQDIPYQTDQEQFGYEKFMFPEEFLSYPSADCEDRSITFSAIIRELLKSPAIGLEYSDHVATAVKFKEQPKGDFITFNNTPYTVCDPTYMGAPIGMSMPKYKNETAKIVVPELLSLNAKSKELIWADLMNRGANRGSNSSDIAFDQAGNAYATGYFNDSLKAHTLFRSVDKSNDLFVAKYDPKQKLVWIKTFGGKGNDIGFNIRLDDQNAILISGLTDNEIQFGNDKVQVKENNDVFVAKLSTEGNPMWIEASGLQTNKQADNNVFTSNFSSQGQLKNMRILPENEIYRDFGISLDPANGDVFFTGSLLANGSLKNKDIKYNDYAAFDILSLYKDESSKLIAQQYHKSLIGIVAVMNLINSTELTVPGNKVQELINKYNPGFKTSNKEVYDNLGKVDFIKNNKGIVVIRSKTGDPVNFSYMKVSNQSKIRIFSYNTGNTQVEVLNGISVGKSIIWYNLNFIKMMKQSGELIFDYDNNHSQKKVDVKELLE